MFLKSLSLFISLLIMQTAQAKKDLSLSELKKILSQQEYMQYTHDLWQKDRKKAHVTDYSEQLNNKQGGNTLTVGPNIQCGFPTIQLAIIFAVPGDHIFVADDLIIGTNAKFNIDKELTIVGGLDSTCQVFTDNRTYLQLDAIGPVITVDVSGGKNVNISGFDISGSQPSNQLFFTSGIFATGDGTLTVSNSHIHNNEALLGGGISAINGVTLNIDENTEIYANTANAQGGGIYCKQSQLNIIDTLIGRFDNGINQGNVVPSEGSQGGGLYSGNCNVSLGETNFGNGVVEINYNKSHLGAGIYSTDSNLDYGHKGSRISFNQTSVGFSGNGNAISASDVNNIIFSDLEISDNLQGAEIQITGSSDLIMGSTCLSPPCSLIQRNMGIPISLQQNATATVFQTIISENIAPSIIVLNSTGNTGLKINNSIIANNDTMSSNSSIILENPQTLIEFENVTISHNQSFASIFANILNIGGTNNFNGGIIWGNVAINLTDENYAGNLQISNSIIQYNPDGMQNTILENPKFVNPENGDFHIKYDSPARDHFNGNLSTDFEGDLRPQGLSDDAGADEWTDLIFANGFEKN